MLVTSAGQVRVTSTSDRILASLSADVLSDPFAEAVGHSVRGHLATWGDFGLTLGALATDLVRTFDENLDNASKRKVRQILDDSLRRAVEMGRFKVDVGSLKQLMSLLTTILDSKPIVRDQCYNFGNIFADKKWRLKILLL
jgi:hypothetical protein